MPVSWMPFFLLGYPLICLVYLIKNREKLDQLEVRKKVDKMYTGLSLGTSYWTILYYPIFIIRRLIVVIIPMFITNISLQLIVLLAMALVYAGWYAYMQPHHSSRLVYIEIMNEIFFVCLIYSMFTFTFFNEVQNMRYEMGWVYMLLIGFFVLLNIVMILRITFDKIKRKKHLKRII